MVYEIYHNHNTTTKKWIQKFYMQIHIHKNIRTHLKLNRHSHTYNHGSTPAHTLIYIQTYRDTNKHIQVYIDTHRTSMKERLREAWSALQKVETDRGGHWRNPRPIGLPVRFVEDEIDNRCMTGRLGHRENGHWR